MQEAMLNLNTICPSAGIPGCLHAPIEDLMGISACQEILGAVEGEGLGFVHSLLDRLKIRAQVDGGAVDAIPETGGVMIVANHPYGTLDGMLVLDLVAQRRRDVRFMGNAALAAFPQLRPLLVGVDLWDNGTQTNALALRHCIEWMKEGGALVVFPAGAVSALRFRHGVMDRPWHASIGGMLRCSKCPAVPLHLAGQANLPVQLGSALPAPLRAALQPKQLLAMRGKQISMQIGSAVSAKRLAACQDDQDRSEYLEFRSYLLAERSRTERRPLASVERQPLIDPVPSAWLEQEIADLPNEACLVRKGNRAVYLTTAAACPMLMREIGRLRELTFRAVGEGSGNACDTDAHDAWFDQLFIWDEDDRAIVGAYRLQEVDASTPNTQLYCNQLFRINQHFLERIGHGIELGRSFVRPRYQRQYNALRLLWQGIGAYVDRRPGATKLFGAVSVSADYSAASKQALDEVLTHGRGENLYADVIRPRSAPQFPRLRGFQRDALHRWGTSMQELTAWIADLEDAPERQHVPVLVRQYAKLGASFTCFNVDPGFSCTMDAFIVVDMETADQKELRRLFGR